ECRGLKERLGRFDLRQVPDADLVYRNRRGSNNQVRSSQDRGGAIVGMHQVQQAKPAETVRSLLFLVYGQGLDAGNKRGIVRSLYASATGCVYDNLLRQRFYSSRLHTAA